MGIRPLQGGNQCASLAAGGSRRATASKQGFAEVGVAMSAFLLHRLFACHPGSHQPRYWQCHSLDPWRNANMLKPSTQFIKLAALCLVTLVISGCVPPTRPYSHHSTYSTPVHVRERPVQDRFHALPRDLSGSARGRWPAVLDRQMEKIGKLESVAGIFLGRVCGLPLVREKAEASLPTCR